MLGLVLSVQEGEAAHFKNTIVPVSEVDFVRTIDEHHVSNKNKYLDILWYIFFISTTKTKINFAFKFLTTSSSNCLQNTLMIENTLIAIRRRA